MNTVSNRETNLRLPNGDNFNGILNDLGSNFLEGKYIYSNEDVYTGKFEYGMRSGVGVYVYTRTG